MRSLHTDQPLLLIADHCLERASGLKKKIENSGNNFRIELCPTPHELDAALSSCQPFGIVAASDAFDPADQQQAIRLLSALPVPLIITWASTGTDFMHALLEQGTAQVVKTNQHARLIALLQEALARHAQSCPPPALQAEVEDLRQVNHLLFEGSKQAIAYVHEGFHVDANRAYLDCMRVEGITDLFGLSLLELMRGIDEDLRQVLRNSAFGPAKSRTLSVTVRDTLGEEFLGELRMSPVRYRGEDCIMLRLEEVETQTGLRQASDEKRQPDRLTGLPGRDAFLAQLEQYLSGGQERAAMSALLYLRPNAFEEYQDTLGHTRADRFLAEFAAIIARCISDSDLACRFSDHGFVILLRRDVCESPEQIANDILDALGEHAVHLDHIELQTRCSIGMISIGPSMSSADEAIRQARVACDQAAQQGHALARFKPTLAMVAPDASSRAGWQERLRFGLDHGHFYSLQHSVVNLEDEGDCYLECCSYLREEQGDTGQDEFLPAADACNISAELDRALLPGLLDAITAQPGAARHIINIGAKTLLDEGFTSWFLNEVGQRHIAGDRLLLQLPAQSLAEQSAAIRLPAQDLFKAGCRLSLSGFTGEPRLLRLLGEPGVVLIKLDPSLTADLLNGQEQRDTVRALVNTAAAAGVDVIVDGIQHATHLAALWQSGIKLVAGDFLRESARVAG